MFPETPQTLMKKIADLANGDDAAVWLEFVELYTPPLRHFVRAVNGAMPDADVEDTVEEVLVRLTEVLRAEGIDRGKGRFRDYLATMTRRILIDRYRAEIVRPRPGAVTAGDLGAVPCGDVSAIDPGVAMDVHWRLAVHESAKNHVLTKTAISAQSRAIYLELERGLSPREAATKFGVSRDVVKQVKSRIDRAIAAIEQRFAE